MPPKKDEDSIAESIFKKALLRVPGWTLGTAGSILVFFICLKFIGLDLVAPANTVVTAYASAIDRQAKGMQKFDDASKEIKTLIEQSNASQDGLKHEVGKLSKDLTSAMDGARVDILAVTRTIEEHESRIHKLEVKK